MKVAPLAGLLGCLIVATFASAADLKILTETGRAVFRRGETVDVALNVNVAADGPATVQWWLQDGTHRLRIATDDLGATAAGPLALTYQIDTVALAPAAYTLIARVHSGNADEQATLPLEIADNTRITDFVIHQISFPGWLLPTGNLYRDLHNYHFNFMLNNLGDSMSRGDNAGIPLTGTEQGGEEMVRWGFDFLKYPTGFGWGLAHRPIRGGASWYDPDIVDISAQLMQYNTQAMRKWPSFKGMNPIDEPGVSWTDPFMAAEFKKRTGKEPPATDKDRDKDPALFAQYQVFRQHVLNDFHTKMKPYVKEVDPDALFTSQTFGDIITHEGLYPSGNTFQDVQSTHTYDHWPTSNNWISFDVNLRRANRKTFWTMPLWTVTGCYGIVTDQWRAAWALGMSEKLDGHGYFLGAGELDEGLPWAEYSMAEMVRINRINERYGNFFLSLQKPVEKLALWYSLEQLAAQDPARQYEQQIVGAYFGMKRAQIPVTIITDEDVRNGLLSEHGVLLLAGAVTEGMPADLRAAVEKFQAGGGKIVVDRASSVDLKNTIPMDADFRGFAQNYAEVERAWFEKRQPVSMALRRDCFADEEILRDLPQIKATLLPLIDRPAYSDSPNTFISVQSHGDARYVFIANEKAVYLHPNEGLRWITMQESVPATDRFTLPIAHGKVIYDLWTGQRIKINANDQVDLDLQAGGLRILCVYPTEMTEPKIGMTANGNIDGAVEISVKPEDRESGVYPALVELRDEKGQLVLRKYVSIDRSSPKLDVWKYVPALNDARGSWEVRIVNLLTGKEIDSMLNSPQKVPPAIVSRQLVALAFDERAYPEFIKRPGLLIVPGKGMESAAQELAKTLNATVKTPEEIRKEDVYPEFLDPVKNKGLWMMPRWQPLNLTTGADLILLGNPTNNILIRDINTSGMLLRVIDPSALGKGEGMVQYVWSPFDTDKDAVILAAFDDAGLKAASDRFLAGAGLTQTDPAKAPQSLPGDLASEVNELAPFGMPGGPQGPLTIKPIWRTKVGDGLHGLSYGSGMLATGGLDSRLTVLDESGKILWHRDFDFRVQGVAVSADGQFIGAAAFPRTHVFDRNGLLQFFSQVAVPSLDDVEGFALSSGTTRLVKGTWSGLPSAYARDGKLVWPLPVDPAKESEKNKEATPPAESDVKPAPPPAPPKPIRCVAMREDGSSVVGFADKLVFYDPAGKETGSVPFDRPKSLQIVGDKILAASFKKKITLLDAAGAKVWEQPTSHFIMSAAASGDGKKFAAALFDGTVVLFDAAGNPKITAKLPDEATFTGVGVNQAGDAIFLSTWEGEVMRWDVK